MVGGGIAPKICDGTYTSHKQAEQELVIYLMKGDRLGFAEYPGKEKNGTGQTE